jgi:hypothetical protein
MVQQKLPSRFQIGDFVKLNFFNNAFFNNCEIIKVHFTENKVMYDVDASFEVGRLGATREYIPITEIASCRLYNIDSAFVVPTKME